MLLSMPYQTGLWLHPWVGSLGAGVPRQAVQLFTPSLRTHLWVGHLPLSATAHSCFWFSPVLFPEWCLFEVVNLQFSPVSLVSVSHGRKPRTLKEVHGTLSHALGSQVFTSHRMGCQLFSPSPHFLSAYLLYLPPLEGCLPVSSLCPLLSPVVRFLSCSHSPGECPSQCIAKVFGSLYSGSLLDCVYLLSLWFPGASTSPGFI